MGAIRWRRSSPSARCRRAACCATSAACSKCLTADRKSTRLNSSHLVISYAVFCLKKKELTLFSFCSAVEVVIVNRSVCHKQQPACRLLHRCVRLVSGEHDLIGHLAVPCIGFHRYLV